MTISILSAGGIVPFQAEGYLDNDLAFYYRDRHGQASLAVSPVKHRNADGSPLNWFDERRLNDNIPASFSAHWIARTNVEEFMGEDTFPTVMSHLLTRLSRNPYHLTFNPDSDHQLHTSGFSAEEAWAATEWADAPMPEYSVIGGLREYPADDPVFPTCNPEEIRTAMENPVVLTDAETQQYQEVSRARMEYLAEKFFEEKG